MQNQFIFDLGLNSNAIIKLKIIAEEIPAVAAVNPPVTAASNPFFAPLIEPLAN
jgi:hypothetical protein